MWAFNDKGNRPVCLIPEVTALIQEEWRNRWSKTSSNKKIFYVSRCYRYERPQEGRYREFTQLGIEYLSNSVTEEETRKIKSTLQKIIASKLTNFTLKDNVKRGLSYYVEDGFEIECPLLGAQKQVAGGGRYKEGIGWAIGIDRLMLAVEKENEILNCRNS